METILANLGGKPIFKMSLGSKELFHSNFLEFLWAIDNNMFIRIINELLTKAGGSGLDTGSCAPKYELSREKENFDICIFHKKVIAKRERTVYDLVIENKVKSMPRKGQLDDYVNKISKNEYSGGCRFLLLSLATGIPDENDIKKTWGVVNYDDLKVAIDHEKSNWQKKDEVNYIEDYCDFIEKMHELQSKILADFNVSQLFQGVDSCRPYRLHDLYIKLRCDKFLIELKKRLENELQKLGQTLPITFISKYNEIQNNGIYLNTSINQGVGQAAAFIHLHDGKPVNNYEIVIQGEQYRHGINSKIATSRDKVTAQEEIWKAIGPDNQNFLNFDFSPQALINGQVILPIKCKKVKGSGEKQIPLNGYDTTCIYKHVDIVKDTEVGDLLDYMAQDIIETIKKF